MCPLCHVIYHSCNKGSWRQSLLTTAIRCNVCGRNLITGLTSAASPRVDISSTCKVGQKLGVCLPLLIRSPSAWPSRLLYRRGRKSRRDLRITLYFPWCLLQCFFKKKITMYCILHRRTCFDTVYCQRYQFTIYIKIWPFARTQLATNDGTQCQNTHADVNYFSMQIVNGFQTIKLYLRSSSPQNFYF
jgi:hypothetical protein